MPLMNPNQLTSGIKEVLKVSKIAPDDAFEEEGGKQKKLKTLLHENGLSPQEVLYEVGSMMRTGETGTVRMRAAEVGLKLNRLLDEGGGTPFQVNIVIKDSQFASINPILIPR